MASIPVETASGSYTVEYSRGLLARAGELVAGLGPSTGVFFLSSPRVWRHWGSALEKSFRIASRAGDGNRAGRRAARFADTRRVLLFPDGERAKTLRTFEKLCRGLAEMRADRGAVLVAVGGGVVGDVAGFAAATYLRGVRLVHVPTTLVAQVDSAIGGKTGVNLPEGKNLVGAFYQPALVIADPDLLRTMPPREYRAGIYEVIKYGVIGDRHLFDFMENRLEAVKAQERAALDWILPRCIGAKGLIVGRDERESGVREVLNFGHTFGHALESLTGYGKFLHGEAVGWGMIAAARLAFAIGWLDRAEAARIEGLVRRVGPLPRLPRITAERWIGAMRGDKKARGGRLRFIVPRRIGEVRSAEGVPGGTLARVLTSLSAPA